MDLVESRSPSNQQNNDDGLVVISDGNMDGAIGICLLDAPIDAHSFFAVFDPVLVLHSQKWVYTS